jgi:hypothetical protein
MLPTVVDKLKLFLTGLGAATQSFHQEQRSFAVIG